MEQQLQVKHERSALQQTGKGWCLSVASFVCTWEKWGTHQPTASEQVYPLRSTLKGRANYPGRQIASCEEQLQIVL